VKEHQAVAIEERTIPADRIEVAADGSLQIREATIILRDGEPEPGYPPRYRRYVLHPGDDLAGKDRRIVAIAHAAWTPEVIAAWRAGLRAVLGPEGAPPE